MNNNIGVEWALSAGLLIWAVVALRWFLKTRLRGFLIAAAVVCLMSLFELLMFLGVGGVQGDNPLLHIFAGWVTGAAVLSAVIITVREHRQALEERVKGVAFIDQIWANTREDIEKKSKPYDVKARNRLGIMVGVAGILLALLVGVMLPSTISGSKYVLGCRFLAGMLGFLPLMLLAASLPSATKKVGKT